MGIISYAQIKSERDLYKNIAEKTIDNFREANKIWTESLKRKRAVIDRLAAEGVEDWIIEMVKSI